MNAETISILKKGLVVLLAIVAFLMLFKLAKKKGGWIWKIYEDVRDFLNKYFFKLVLLVVFLVFVTFIMYKYGTIISFLSVFYWIAGFISDSTAINKWLVYMIAGGMTAPIFISMGMMISKQEATRRWGYVIFSVTIVIFSALMLFAEKETVSNLNRVVPSRETVFFNQNKEPMYRYMGYPDGKLEFFPKEMKSHPQTGDNLKVVDKKIVMQFFSYVDNKRYDMIIGSNNVLNEIARPIEEVNQKEKDEGLEGLRNHLKNKIERGRY